ncbi:MAG: hypothetical protein ACRD2G_04275, partial [Terriglobia bacterium]
MAKILSWREKLVLAFVSVFLSATAAWPRGTQDAVTTTAGSYSHLVTTSGTTRLGVELMARRPYVRVVRALGVPVSLPLTTGAYVALAGAMGAAAPAGNWAAGAAPDGAAAAPNTSCSTHTGGTTGGGGTECRILYCSGGFAHHTGNTCETCGYGTCGVC